MTHPLETRGAAPARSPVITQPARLLVALTLSAAAASSWAALPVFTLNPGGAVAPLNGVAVTADNLVVSNRSHVVTDAGAGTFVQTGLLSIQTLQLEGEVVSSLGGLNSTYGLYMSYNAAGTLNAGNTDPLAGFTSGAFTSFNYTLYGFNGSAAVFSFDGANNAIITTPTPAITLGSGHLLQGSVSTSLALNGSTPSFVPSANATLTFAATPGESGFFSDPSPFYNLGYASFTNTVSQVGIISGSEYRIQQGGGAFNFAASAVPEPESYAMMFAGLGIMGFLGRRRRKE